MKKLWVVALALSLLVALYVRTTAIAEPHTLEYDSEGMYKLAKQVVEQGGIPEKDPLRYANYFEGGWDNREVLPLTPFAIAGLSFWNPDLVKTAAMWYPPFFGVLGIIVVAYIGKMLFGYPGLVAGAFLSVLPGYLFRTSAGVSDKEAVCMFAILLGMYFYISSLKNKDKYRAILSGICFGTAAFGWNGYQLFVIPIGLFTMLEVFRGRTDENISYLFMIPIVIFMRAMAEGIMLQVLHTYQTMLMFGVAFYLLVDKLLGAKLSKIPIFMEINFFVDEMIKGFGKSFRDFKISGSGIPSALVSLAVGVLVLIALGRDPVQTIFNMLDFMSNPIRRGIHARSVGEQMASQWPQWKFEINALQLIFPLTYVLDPTQALYAMVLTSIPLTVLLFLFTKKWEHLFISIWAFFGNFSAATAVRLFFPMMPAVALAGAAVVAYLLDRNKGLVRQISYLVPVAIFMFCIVSTVDAARSLKTSLDPLWWQSLIWYNHNSQPLSPLATWWDYGYWIFAEANRPSLADGSNTYYEADVDLGLFFTETNETAAIEYLKRQKTHFVTMDGTMVGKFYWVSSIGKGSEEKAIVYPQFSFAQNVNTNEYGPGRLYYSASGQQILITNKIIAFNTPEVSYWMAIPDVVSREGYLRAPMPENVTPYPGAILISNDYALLIPPSAKDIIFTRLFFLKAVNLEHFEPVFDNGFLQTYRAEW